MMSSMETEGMQREEKMNDLKPGFFRKQDSDYPKSMKSMKNIIEELDLPAARITTKHETLHDGPALSESDKATLLLAKTVSGNRVRQEQRNSPMGGMDISSPRHGAPDDGGSSFQGWKIQSSAKKQPKHVISEQDKAADEEKFEAAKARRKALRRRSTVLALEDSEVSQQKAAANEDKIATLTLGGRRASLAMAEIKAAAVSARRGSVISRESSSGSGANADSQVVPDAYDEDDFAFDHDTIEFPDGSCYNGDFLFQVEGLHTARSQRLVVRHGKGSYLFPPPDQSLYDGWWEMDRQHGQGTIKYENGSVFNGSFSKGEMVFGELKLKDGTKYLGDFQDGIFHGEGDITWADGSSYVGPFFKGKRHGSDGEYVYKNGDRYVGDWEHGEQHGHGILVSKKGHRYEGAWKHGKMHGKGTLKYARGEVYEGGFAHGRREGRGRLSDSQGGYYDGEWVKDQRHGKGCIRAMEFVEGKVQDSCAFYTYDGGWSRGLKHGEGTLVHSTGEMYTGMWKHDVKEGEGTMVGKTLTYSGRWKNGKRHGPGELTSKDGWFYKGEFVSGVQEGKGICQGPSGSTYTGEWKDGKPHGEGTVLQRGSDGHGDVAWTGKWKNGLRVGETKVDSDDFSFFISYPSMGDKMGASKIKMKKKEVDRFVERSPQTNPLHAIFPMAMTKRTASEESEKA